MSDENKWVELLKPPVWGLTIVGCLWMARYGLDMQIGSPTEVGPGGVKFATAAGPEIAELKSKVDGALVAIRQLKDAQPPQSAASSAATQAAIDSASMVTSERVAKLADVAASATKANPVRGYIWIGDFEGTRWTRSTVAWPAPTQAPTALSAGTELTVTSNTYVREGLPANDAAYFNAQRVLGVATIGSKIRIVTPPKMIDREFAKQYWVQVDVLSTKQ